MGAGAAGMAPVTSFKQDPPVSKSASALPKAGPVGASARHIFKSTGLLVWELPLVLGRSRKRERWNLADTQVREEGGGEMLQSSPFPPVWGEMVG